MEIPSFNGTYTNECEVKDVAFLNKVMAFVDEYVPVYPTFLHGLCYSCKAFESPSQPLQRCGGCQLVSYCSRECQKNDRPTHKHVCKEFPLVNGKNVLTSEGRWKEHIASLRERAACLTNSYFAARLIFRNPWVCYTCKEARHEHLRPCRCAFISYCSRRCAEADKKHYTICYKDNSICDMLWDAAKSYSLNKGQSLPSLTDKFRDPFRIQKFRPVENYNDLVPLNYWWTNTSFQLLQVFECLSFPMSLLYALQQVPGRRLGPSLSKLEDITALTIHVVTSSPSLDSEGWEVFMHRLTKLKDLDVVFIMQGKPLGISFGLNKKLSLLRCDECKANNRIITYSVQQMLYHLYFSSTDYIEPDVVVVYGNKHEMMEINDNIHSKISYRNMIHSKDTVLVLMDEDRQAVKHGLNMVEAASPIKPLVPTMVNPLRTHGLKLDDMWRNKASEDCNVKKFFTCIRRK